MKNIFSVSFVIGIFVFFLKKVNAQAIKNVLMGGVEPGRIVIKGKTTYTSKDQMTVVSNITSTTTQNSLITPDITIKDGYFTIVFSDEDAIKEDNIYAISISDKTTNEVLWKNGVLIPSINRGINIIVSSNIKSNSHSYVLKQIEERTNVTMLMILGNIYQSPKKSGKEEDYTGETGT